MDSIIPGARTVAVTSGKGGVGKTSTTVALATNLAARGLDVLVIDGDLEGPNVHLVADVADLTLGVDGEHLTLNVPTSPLGFRVLSPVSVTQEHPRAQVSALDLIGMARFLPPPDVVLIDLPPGWTDSHDVFAHSMPEFVVAVIAPTSPAISDHRRHMSAWEKAWARAVEAHKSRDRRRKVTLPERPTVTVVETMARFTGIPETGGDPVTVRRIDALPADQMAELVAAEVSIPSSASVAEAAQLPEIGQLGDLVMADDDDQAAV